MRIALVSDIHGNLPALEAVVAHLATRDVARVLNLGDHVSGPLWPHETADRLMDLGWTAIAGNHDRQVLGDPATLIPSDAYAREHLASAHLAWLRSIPATTTVVTAEGTLLLVHGVPTDDCLYLLETANGGRLQLAADEEVRERLGRVDADIVACGHSHVPRVVTMPSGLTIVNPGSVGLQAYEAHTPERHVSETGSPHARYAILEQDGHRWSVEHVALEYDWDRAASHAAANGRDDWAFSLRTGYAPRARSARG
jgi:predicted phosphodiesterase